VKLEVIKPYTRVYENPIMFLSGERVRVVKRDVDNLEWIWCVADDAKEGWVHESFLELDPDGSSAIGIRDYTALELTVTTDEKLEGFEMIAGWQWCKNARDEAGWVPLEHVRTLE
jgi:Variant SH3 domain